MFFCAWGKVLTWDEIKKRDKITILSFCAAEKTKKIILPYLSYTILICISVVKCIPVAI